MHVGKNIFLVLSLLAPPALLLVACGKPSPASNPGTVTSPDPLTGGVSITGPASGSSVASPFQLTASAATCSSQPVTSMSYALDSNAATSINGTSISVQLSAVAGDHTLQVTAQGDSGATCNASESITVAAAAAPPAPPSPPTPPAPPAPPDPASNIPADAVSVSEIQALSNWEDQNDPGTNGPSSGSMALVSSPSLSGDAREFDTSFSGSGGELYHVTFGHDTTVQNFFYDGWVYLTSSAGSIANLEMDMNQVMSNGQTVIYGFQCDGYSGTWDYTENAGTPASPSDRWVHSSAACNVRKWSQNIWHHIQISYSRDDAGDVTYNSVWLDGTEAQINATVPSSFALGWGSVLLTNFQVDGLGAGSNTVYLHTLTISRW